MWDNKDKIHQAVGKLAQPSYHGEGIESTLLTKALDLGMKAAPVVGRRAWQAGKYYTSQALRNPRNQSAIINYALDKGKPILTKVGKEALTQLSASIRPKRKDGKQMHTTDIKGLYYSEAGLVDSLLEQASLAKRLSAVPEGLKLLKEALKGSEMSNEDAKKLVAEYKRQYEEYKRHGGKKGYSKWIWIWVTEREQNSVLLVALLIFKSNYPSSENYT